MEVVGRWWSGSSSRILQWCPAGWVGEVGEGPRFQSFLPAAVTSLPELPPEHGRIPSPLAVDGTIVSHLLWHTLLGPKSRHVSKIGSGVSFDTTTRANVTTERDLRKPPDLITVE